MIFGWLLFQSVCFLAFRRIGNIAITETKPIVERTIGVVESPAKRELDITPLLKKIEDGNMNNESTNDIADKRKPDLRLRNSKTEDIIGIDPIDASIIAGNPNNSRASLESTVYGKS
ncbi:MAG TPA: hypothetical protein VEU72_02920 [Nitrosopumilaceae archaeon]|nr:hypothetical protein [Nitrosopumilaceae archaeon]